DVIGSFRGEESLELFLVDRDGEVILSTDESNVGLNVANKNYFSKGSEGVFVDSGNLESVDSEFVIPIAAPVYLRNDEEERFLGVLVSLIDNNELNRIMTSEIGLGETERSYVVNEDSRLLTPYYKGEIDYLYSEIESHDVADCSTEADLDIQERVSNGFNREGEEVLISYIYNNDLHWCMVFEVNNEEVFYVLNGMIRSIVMVGIVALIISYFIIDYISKKITRPIKQLQKGIEIIAKGNLEYKVGMKGEGEISVLSREFDKMNSTIRDFKLTMEEKVNNQTLDIRTKRDSLEKQQRAILNILEDVEREKVRSEDLAHDLKKFKMAVDNASDHIVITDIDGVILYANEATEKITGFSVDEVVGKKAGDSENWGGVMDKEFYDGMWEVLKEKKKPFVGEMENKRKNGERYDVVASISPITNNKGDILFFVAIERDITKEKEIDRAKTEFVSLASHQLRTPLSAISWYTEMLLNQRYKALNL
ncbi:PAS domain S-box protein, partial [Patescibacteria group bacterium]